LADDHSIDKTLNISHEITGIKHIRNEKNLGFLQNCMNAAKHAKGEYLLLLNNDMLFYNDWLAPMVSMLAEDSSIGIIGPILISPLGKILELGNFMTKNLELIRIGHGQRFKKNNSYPQMNFDFKAGCAMLMKKTLWEYLHGFDIQFSPAYYEDVDFCFRVKEKGLRIVNCQKSVVIHYETLSYNDIDHTDKICSNNHQKFFNKWKKVLNQKHKTADEILKIFY
jgi:GT2 family glycosyltransferase